MKTKSLIILVGVLVGATFLSRPAHAATVWVDATGAVLFMDRTDRADAASTNTYTPIRINPADAGLALEVERDTEAVRQIGVQPSVLVTNVDGEIELVMPTPPAPVFTFLPVTPGLLHTFNLDRTWRLMTGDEQSQERDNKPPVIFESRIVANGVDVLTDDPQHGLILTDTSTNKWLLSVVDGSPALTQISASPEVDYVTRKARLVALRAAAAANPQDYNPRLLRLELKDLLDRRLDVIKTNNCITTAGGRFTVFSSTVANVNGATCILDAGNLCRLFTVVNTASNSATFQVWLPAGTKAGIETNNYVVTLTR